MLELRMWPAQIARQSAQMREVQNSQGVLERVLGQTQRIRGTMQPLLPNTRPGQSSVQ